MQILTFIAVLSSFLFITYGLSCFISSKLKLEFTRYGFEKYRVLIACSEIAGALGILFGLYYTPLMLMSSALLTGLMIGAVIVRIRIKDAVIRWVPALILLILNVILLVGSYNSYF